MHELKPWEQPRWMDKHYNPARTLKKDIETHKGEQEKNTKKAVGAGQTSITKKLVSGGLGKHAMGKTQPVRQEKPSRHPLPPVAHAHGNSLLAQPLNRPKSDRDSSASRIIKQRRSYGSGCDRDFAKSQSTVTLVYSVLGWWAVPAHTTRSPANPDRQAAGERGRQPRRELRPA